MSCYNEKKDITLADKINIAMAILTLLSVLGVFVTLHEMKIQRNATYNPEIVMNPVDVHIQWNEETRESWTVVKDSEGKIIEGVTEEKHPALSGFGMNERSIILDVTNVGVGTAKNVTFKWKEDNVEKLRDYLIRCDEKNAEFCHINDMGITFRIADSSILIGKEAAPKLMYMLPEAKDEYRLSVPMQYNCLIHEGIKHGYMMKERFPEITLLVSYQDIQGNDMTDEIKMSIEILFHESDQNACGQAMYTLMPVFQEEHGDWLNINIGEKIPMNIVEILNVVFNGILSLVSVYIAYKVYKLNKKDYQPKLAVRVNQKRVGTAFEWNVNKEILDLDMEQDGFPVREEHHKHLLWELIIYNNSDVVATNIELKYHIVIKKMDFSYGIDEADIIEPHLVDFAVIDRKVNCEYLVPRGKTQVKVLYLIGEFPAAELYIDYFKCGECEFINKKVKVDTYEHLGFEYIEDSPHMRRLYGAGRTAHRNNNVES